LEHQSLKILPQAPFIDAVNQYVNKDDKRAMDEFVKDVLTGQVKQILSLDNDEDDIPNEMAKFQAKLNDQFKQGLLKRRKAVAIKPKPAHWDSDMDGPWEDQPGVVTYENEPEVMPQLTKGGRGRPKAPTQTVEDEEMEDFVEEDEITPKPKGRGRAATTTTKAPAKAPAKASAKKAATKAPSKASARAPAKTKGRKAVFDENSEEDDVIMDDEPVASPPRRAAMATRSQPPRGGGPQSQAKMKQATLNFSQKPKTSQVAVEISDDEISDDDDPFETMPAKKVTRKK
jgi:double-strand break repair protein MRE11